MHVMLICTRVMSTSYILNTMLIEQTNILEYTLTLGTIFISVTFLPSFGPTFLNLKCFTSSAY